MTWWTYDNLRLATGGAWRIAPPTPGDPVSAPKVSIDSRAIRAGEVFVAIRGERFDGHAFVEEAFHRGASAAIVNVSGGVPTPLAGPTLAVEDTTRALADLACTYRKSWKNTQVFGVTGSNGKTTTCRLLDAALGASLKGSCSQKSFNNHIGLPLTLLGVQEGDDYVICEMGTSSPGEIARLSEIARPDAAIITSIGRAHLEGLGGVEGVKREKSEIATGMRPGGLLLTRDIDGLDSFLRRRDIRHVRFGRSASAARRIDRVRALESGTSFTMDDAEWFVPLAGEHNALNAGAAAALALEIGLKPEAVRIGLGSAARASMRFEVAQTGDITLVNDAYNANPDSVRASLRTFVEVTPGAGRRVVVLGDMLELGDASAAEHALVGEEIGAGTDIDVVITVGAHAGHIGRTALARNPMLETYAFDTTTDAACAAIASLLRPGDAALLKGSRGVGLERAADAIALRFRDGVAATGA